MSLCLCICEIIMLAISTDHLDSDYLSPNYGNTLEHEVKAMIRDRKKLLTILSTVCQRLTSSIHWQKITLLRLVPIHFDRFLF